MKCDCLAPIINNESQILILGTIPGNDSISKNEYYANSDNVFWDIIYRVFNEAVNADHLIELSYDEKKQLILKNNLGLWDILESCERKGNRDSKIRNEICNNIPDFISKYPNIKEIIFNGQKACDYFKKSFPALSNSTSFRVMYSTSPSNPVNTFYILYKWSELKRLLQPKGS